jgi:hypothetical protein
MYTVGSAAFPTLEVNEADVTETLEKCGFKILEWTTCRKESTHYFAILTKN